MTYQQFLDREIATWGEDYIFALLDRGYVAILLTNGTGQVRWTWLLKQTALTQAPAYATVSPGSSAGFTPVFPANRAFVG